MEVADINVIRANLFSLSTVSLDAVNTAVFEDASLDKTVCRHPCSRIN